MTWGMHKGCHHYRRGLPVICLPAHDIPTIDLVSGNFIARFDSGIPADVAKKEDWDVEINI